MIEIGKRVVCIKECKWTPLYGPFAPCPEPVPHEGRTYLVIEIVRPKVWGLYRGKVLEYIGLFLYELPGFHWDSEFFRPVIERETSIEVFQKALGPPIKELTHEPA